MGALLVEEASIFAEHGDIRELSGETLNLLTRIRARNQEQRKSEQ